MPLRVCPNVGPYCPEDPIGNYSSEASDLIDYVSTQYAGEPQPLLHNWSSTMCGKTYISTISQLDADLQARSAAELCNCNSCLFLNNPQTCCVPCADGSQTCYTVPGGLFPGANQASADALAHEVACELAQQYPICLTGLVDNACINKPYSGELIAGVPVNWSVTGGSLPPGLKLTTTPVTAILSGTPTVAGAYAFQIQATRFDGPFTVRIVQICVVDIAPVSATLPAATQGTAYSATFSPTSCAGSVTWSVSLGSLPPGLTLDPNSGILSGTPTTNGSYMFTVQMVGI